MREQEAKALASEFAGNHTWHVGAVYHWSGEDGWRILLELRVQSNLRYVIATPDDARPGELADIRDALLDINQRWHFSPSRTELITLAPDGEDYLMPTCTDWQKVREEARP